MTKYFLVVVAFFAGMHAFAYNAENTKVAESCSKSRAPLSFLENHNVTDQNKRLRTDIQFRVEAAPGLNIFIGEGTIHYQFSKIDQPINQPAHGDNLQKQSGENKVNYSMYRLDVELVGANKKAKVLTEGKEDYFENYLSDVTDKNMVTDHGFSRLTYKDIYPNIDWILYFQNGQMKHEFIVRKGGKVSSIRLKYGGAENLDIIADGSLVAKTPLGVITERAPVSYSNNGNTVDSRFKLNNDVLSYAVDDYSGTLTIDPTLMWATYYGGENTDDTRAVAVDPSGNVFIIGCATSSTGIATVGAYQSTNLSGARKPYLAKFNSSGARQWATFVGDGEGFGVSTDPFGNVYITGIGGVSTPGAYKTSGADAFVAKFSSTGSLLWGSLFGGNGNGEQASAVSTDQFGNVFITGILYGSHAGLATAGAYQPFYGGGVVDAFLAKFNSSGTLQWATYFGGSGDDAGRGVATDIFGNVFLSGGTTSTNGIATTGAYLSSPSNGFLAKFNGAGALQWSTYYNGLAQSVATDGAGNPYITGGDYVAKFDGAGAYQWSNTIPGGGQALCRAMAIDPTGNVYITGAAEGAVGIITAGAYQSSFAGDHDAYLAIYNSAGILQYGTYFGGVGFERACGLDVDNTGNVYICGEATSTSSIASPGAHQTVMQGVYANGYLAKFNFISEATPCQTHGDASVCLCHKGHTIAVAPSAVAAHLAHGDYYGGCHNTAKLASIGKTEDESQVFTVSPNPAQRRIEISSDELITTVLIENLVGQKVYMGSYNSRAVQIDMVGLPSGLYLVMVNGTYVRRVVKE